MTTFGVMKARIASELDRSDLTALIGDHIQDAIQTHRGRRWWFLEGPTSGAYTSTTTAGNSYVSLYPGLIQLDSLRITVNGQVKDLSEISFQTMEWLHDGSSSNGEPYNYNVRAEQMRLYPTPDQVYTLTWKGLFEEAALSADGDSNDWTTTAAPLIRAHAMMTLYRDTIRDQAGVAEQKEAVAVAIDALDREHMRRRPTRIIKPGW